MSLVGIIGPLGYRAKEHNEEFEQERAGILNSFTKEFLGLFCDNGIIDWSKLVKFNSGNMDVSLLTWDVHAS